MTWNFPPWFGVALTVGGLLFVALHVAVLVFCLRGRRKVAGVAALVIALGWAIAGSHRWPAVAPAALYAALGVWALGVVRPRTLIAMVAAGAAALVVLPMQLRMREARQLEADSEAWQAGNAARCERLAARYALSQCSELPSATQVGPYDDAPGTTFWVEHRCASTYFNAIYQLQDDADGHDAGDGAYWSARAATFAEQLADCVEDGATLRGFGAELRKQQRVEDLEGFRVDVSPWLDGGTKVAITTGGDE